MCCGQCGSNFDTFKRRQSAAESPPQAEHSGKGSQKCAPRRRRVTFADCSPNWLTEVICGHFFAAATHCWVTLALVVLLLVWWPFIICQCQWESVRQLSLLGRSMSLCVRCLHFVKMEMKKICTVAAFVAFFLLRDVLGVCMSFLIIFVFPVPVPAQSQPSPSTSRSPSVSLHFLCSLAHSCLFSLSAPRLLGCSPFVFHFYAYFRMSCESCARLLRATIFEMRQLFANVQQLPSAGSSSLCCCYVQFIYYVDTLKLTKEMK